LQQYKEELAADPNTVKKFNPLCFSVSLTNTERQKYVQEFQAKERANLWKEVDALESQLRQHGAFGYYIDVTIDSPYAVIRYDCADDHYIWNKLGIPVEEFSMVDGYERVDGKAWDKQEARTLLLSYLETLPSVSAIADNTIAVLIYCEDGCQKAGLAPSYIFST
jgi:hypothetical protein